MILCFEKEAKHYFKGLFHNKGGFDTDGCNLKNLDIQGFDRKDFIVCGFNRNGQLNDEKLKKRLGKIHERSIMQMRNKIVLMKF